MAAAPHFRGRCARPRVFAGTLQVPREGVRLAWKSLGTLREEGARCRGGPAVGGGRVWAGHSEVGARDRVGGTRGPGKGQDRARPLGLPPPPLPAQWSPRGRHLHALMGARTRR